MIWAQIAVSIALSLISSALTPNPKPPPPAGIDEVDVPLAEAGDDIPVIFGEMLITNYNTVTYGRLRVSPIRKKGGK